MLVLCFNRNSALIKQAYTVKLCINTESVDVSLRSSPSFQVKDSSASPYNFSLCIELRSCICVVVDAESVLYGVRGNQEIDLDELTFKLVVRSRDKPDPGPPYTVTLMAPSAQEKAAWTSDISQVSFPCQLITSYQRVLHSRPSEPFFSRQDLDMRKRKLWIHLT